MPLGRWLPGYGEGRAHVIYLEHVRIQVRLGIVVYERIEIRYLPSLHYSGPTGAFDYRRNAFFSLFRKLMLKKTLRVIFTAVMPKF